ncbi:MAG: hypothetical protein HYZ34_02320 [Ignavibacteriae bacterium]|nr:hypothetical protein [Ignavibacteriota bacterium]
MITSFPIPSTKPTSEGEREFVLLVEFSSLGSESKKIEMTENITKIANIIRQPENTLLPISLAFFFSSTSCCYRFLLALLFLPFPPHKFFFFPQE